MLPMLSLGILYWYGRPQPRRTAYLLATGLPILTLVVCGVAPVVRVVTRVDDGNLQARLVDGNGVRLIWAADGVGWPREGLTWPEAVRRCQHLTEDGRALSDSPECMAVANGGGSRALDVTSRRQQWRDMEPANQNGNVCSAP